MSLAVIVARSYMYNLNISTKMKFLVHIPQEKLPQYPIIGLKYINK